MLQKYPVEFLEVLSVKINLDMYLQSSMEDIYRLPFVTSNLNVFVLCTFRKGCE